MRKWTVTALAGAAAFAATLAILFAAFPAGHAEAQCIGGPAACGGAQTCYFDVSVPPQAGLTVCGFNYWAGGQFTTQGCCVNGYLNFDFTPGGPFYRVTTDGFGAHSVSSSGYKNAVVVNRTPYPIHVWGWVAT